jgi:predicted nucleotidyltransferase
MVKLEEATSKLIENPMQHRKALKEVFERQEVMLAYLFGSHARGDAGPLSDIDVAMLFGSGVPEDQRLRRVLQLIGELGSVFGQDDVYVVDLAEASPLLRHRVYRDGRLLYCRNEVVQVQFETKALRDYIDTEPLRKIKRKYVLQRCERLKEKTWWWTCRPLWSV